MKKVEMVKLLESGNVLACGEYLMSRPERIEYRDKSTKLPASMDKLGHTILTEHGAITVEQDTRKLVGFDVGKYVSPFKKGQRVCVVVSSMVNNLGVITLRGVPHPVED